VHTAWRNRSREHLHLECAQCVDQRTRLATKHNKSPGQAWGDSNPAGLVRRFVEVFRLDRTTSGGPCYDRCRSRCLNPDGRHSQKLDATTRQRYAYRVANPEESMRIFVKKVQDANQERQKHHRPVPTQPRPCDCRHCLCAGWNLPSQYRFWTMWLSPAALHYFREFDANRVQSKCAG